MTYGFPGFFHFHRLAIVVFATLAALFLWDVLILDYSLGAFDIILNQPSWKGEFPITYIHQPILSDSPAAHFPQREFDWGHARQLNNPEFNPYIFTGMPWGAQGIGAFITSLAQLTAGVANAIDWSTWLRLFLAGFFMYLLMLELGVSRMAGIFAGIMWTYSLHQVVWLEFPQHLATQLWIPLLFLFNIRILQNGLDAPAGVALVVVNVLFITSGYMQIVLYTYVLVGFFNTVYALIHWNRTGAAAGLGRWTGVHAMYIAAVLVCAVGLVAETKFISEGLRGAQDWRGRVDAPELSIESIAGLVGSFFPRLSEATHVLSPDYYGGFWSGRYQYEHGNVVESARYFGIFGVLFAVAALVSAWGTRHFRAVVVCALAMAFVFSMFYRNEFTIGLLRLIPFADKGSYSRFITLLTFLGCILAAYGYYHALGRRYWGLFAAMTVVLVFVLASWHQLDEFSVSRMWYPALLIAGLAVVVVVRNVLEVDWKWVGCLVVAATAVDLIAAGHGFNTRMENDRLFPKSNTIRFLLNDPEPYRVAVVSEKPLYHPNILSFYDIPVVEGYSTVLPVAYTEYIDELFPRAHVTRNGILFLLEPNVEALRLMNVKYVLSDEPLAEEHEGLEHVIDSNDHGIFRVRDHLDRVFCASDVFFVEDEGRLVKEYRKRLGGYDTPVVLAGSGGHASGSGACRVEALEVYTHGLDATIRSDEDRYLVIPYAFSENWRASIDGEPRRLEKANGYHMALRVPRGESDVTLTYRNPWTRLSALIYAIASLCLLVWLLRARGVGAVSRAALGGVAVLVILKSSWSLPPVRNEAIPERSPPGQAYEVVQQGEGRHERELHSARVTADNPVRLPLGIPSKGLVRLSLLAGTFHQRTLEQTVTVRILDAEGNVLVERHVEGPEVRNNNWFTIHFPAIEKDTDLHVAVSTREPDRSKSFILWLDANGDVCIRSFYRMDSGPGERE